MIEMDKLITPCTLVHDTWALSLLLADYDMQITTKSLIFRDIHRLIDYHLTKPNAPRAYLEAVRETFPPPIVENY